jgi:hypothetical protein
MAPCFAAREIEGMTIARRFRPRTRLTVASGVPLLLGALCALVVVAAPQRKPDFSGTWVLNVARSGAEPEIWLQRRAVRFNIKQTDEELTLDTGDGSLFGVADPVTQTPLRYRLGGSTVTVLDTSLGDLPNFKRQIRTEASWEKDSRLVTYTTHFAETPRGANDGNTRVLIFSIVANNEMKVERTGYRGPRPDPSRLFGPLPTYLHNGRLEDDRVYAQDTAYYTRAARVRLNEFP